MNRNILLGGFAIIVIVVIGGFLVMPDRSSSTETNELKRIKIATFPGSPNAHYPIYVAQQEGFFADEGLEVEIVTLLPGLSSAALLGGEIDYSQYIREVVTAALQGVPVAVAAMYPDEPVATIIAAEEISKADITSIGPKVPHSTQHYYALKAADEIGGDVEVVTSNALTLLAAGKIDAAVGNLADPFILADENYHIVEVVSSDLLFGISTLSETIQNNPEEVAGVIRARERAFAFMHENPEAAKAYMHEVLQIDKTERGMQSVTAIYDMLLTRSDDIQPSEAAMNELIQLAKSADFKTLEDITTQTATAEDRAKAFDLSALELMLGHE